jgi:hypothetical protein
MPELRVAGQGGLTDDGLSLFFTARSAQDGSPAGGVGRDVRKILQTNTEEAAQGCAAEQEEMMVSDEALKKLQEQIAAWPMERRFVVQQLIRDYLRNREDLRAYEATRLTPRGVEILKEEKISSDGVILLGRLMGKKLHEIGCERLRELAEADKDGRVVVLPCKVGQRVFALLDTDKHISECEVKQIGLGNEIGFVGIEPIGARGREYGVSIKGFGKTVFLTREAAEKELEEIRNGNGNL